MAVFISSNGVLKAENVCSIINADFRNVSYERLKYQWQPYIPVVLLQIIAVSRRINIGS